MGIIKQERQQEKAVIHRGTAKIWMGSMIAAFVAAIAVYAVMMQMEKNMLTQYEKGSILRAVKVIPKGQLITSENSNTYLEEVKLDKNGIPSTAIIFPEQVCNLVSKADIDEGTLLTEGMFIKMNDITAGMRQPVIAGFRAEDLYQVAGGILRAGDRIHIYSVNEEGEAKLVWADVFVQQVFDQTGTVISNENVETPAQRINVYLDKTDVESFYSELSGGSLRAVKVWE